MKLLYIDVETTGLIKYMHGIIDLSYIIEDEEENIVDKGTLYMNPLSYTKEVSNKALKINGYTLKQIKGFSDAKEVCLDFINILNKYSNNKKYKVVAFNANFDIGFIQEWMNKLIPGTYGKLIDYKYLDPFEVIKYLQFLGKINTGYSQGLAACCKCFDIQHKPHNSLSDIEATRELHKLLIKDYLW